jgi:hypothetical protein
LENVETQWADNRMVIDRVGAVLGEELKDGLSAWRKGVKRPGWEALLKRVQSGASDGIVVWHTDRLFRQPRDLETLIDLADKGFRVFSAHGERDLSNPDDRFILRVEVAHAARSSDDTSRRLRRKFEVMREQHKSLGGARGFGYPGRDLLWTPGKDQTREDAPMVSADLVAAEQQALRDGADDLLAGVASQGKIARRWNEAGLRTVFGNEWEPISVRTTLSRECLGQTVKFGATVVEPILTDRTFARLTALFAGRKRGRQHGDPDNGAVYVCSGTLRCGLCGTKLSGSVLAQQFHADGTQRAAYYCAKARRGCGMVKADTRRVDTEMRKFVLQRLSDPRHSQAMSEANAKVAARLAVVLAEIKACADLQVSLSARLGGRKMTEAAFDAANEPLVLDLARLTAERDSLQSTEVAQISQADSVEQLARDWDEGTVTEKRAMLANAVGRDLVVVDPYGGQFAHGKRAFDPARIRLIPAAKVPEWLAGRADDVATARAERDAKRAAGRSPKSSRARKPKATQTA